VRPEAPDHDVDHTSICACCRRKSFPQRQARRPPSRYEWLKAGFSPRATPRSHCHRSDECLWTQCIKLTVPLSILHDPAEVRSSKPTCFHRLLSRQLSLTSSLASCQRTIDAELRSVAVNAVRGVQVLLYHDLEASGAALAGSDDGPCEEEFPDLLKERSVKEDIM
jgi:hypothetical protein